MKIGSIENKPAVTSVSNDRKSTGTTAAGKGASESSATVALSPEASALSAVAGDGSFDAGKVERVSQAIKDGTYKVNPEAIADKLIANAQELLSRTYR